MYIKSKLFQGPLFLDRSFLQRGSCPFWYVDVTIKGWLWLGRQVSRFVNWMSVGVITSLSAVLLLLFYYLTHSSINITDGRTQGIIVVFIFRFLLGHLLYYQNELRVWFPTKLMQVLLYLYIVSVIYPVININSAHFICFWKLQVSHSQRKNFDQKQI